MMAKYNINVNKLREGIVKEIVKGGYKKPFEDENDFNDQAEKTLTWKKSLEKIKSIDNKYTDAMFSNEITDNMKQINGFFAKHLEIKKEKDLETAIKKIEGKRLTELYERIDNLNVAFKIISFNWDEDCIGRNADKVVAWVQHLLYRKTVEPTMLLFYSSTHGTGKSWSLNAIQKACEKLKLMTRKVTSQEIMGKFSTDIFRPIVVGIISEFKLKRGYRIEENNIEKMHNMIDGDEYALEKKGSDIKMRKSNIVLAGATNDRIYERRFSNIQVSETQISDLRKENKKIPTEEKYVNAFVDIIINAPTPQECKVDVTVINENDPFKDRADYQELYGAISDNMDIEDSTISEDGYIEHDFRTFLKYIAGDKKKPTPTMRAKWEAFFKRNSKINGKSNQQIIKIEAKSKQAFQKANIKINIEDLVSYLNYNEDTKFTAKKYFKHLMQLEEDAN